MALRDRIAHIVEGTLMPSTLKYVAIVFLLITIVQVSLDPGKRKRVRELLYSPFFILGLTMVALWSYITLGFKPITPQDFQIRLATKRALFALVTVFLAEVHLTIMPFWLFWVASYYMDLGG